MADYRLNPFTGKQDYYKRYVFTGSGVSCVDSGDVTTCTISGGSSSAPYSVIDDAGIGVIDDGSNIVKDDS